MKEEHCTHSSILLHEFGHQMGLGHAGTEKYHYDDKTSVMGTSAPTDEDICFNPVMNKYLNWYEDRFQSWKPCEDDDLENFALAGVASSIKETIAIVIDEKFYIGFNFKAKMNKDTFHGNEVTIHSKETEKRSHLLKTIGEKGTYDEKKWRLKVKAIYTEAGIAQIELKGKCGVSKKKKTTKSDDNKNECNKDITADITFHCETKPFR